MDMVRVPDWAIEAAGQEMRGMGQDAATYHPGLYLTPAQVKRESVLIFIILLLSILNFLSRNDFSSNAERSSRSTHSRTSEVQAQGSSY